MNKHAAPVSDALWLYRVSWRWQEGVYVKAVKWSGKQLRPPDGGVASEGVARLRASQGGLAIAERSVRIKLHSLITMVCVCVWVCVCVCVASCAPAPALHLYIHQKVFTYCPRCVFQPSLLSAPQSHLDSEAGRLQPNQDTAPHRCCHTAAAHTQSNAACPRPQI